MNKLITSFVFLFLFCSVSQTKATKMLHRNAQELTLLAERVFIGTCISVEEKQMNLANGGSLTYTEYTFEVIQSIKGGSSGAVVLRQVGPATGVGSIIGMPAYKIDRKYLLFLRGESEYGLASPIGLGQGSFRIFKTTDGSEKAINAFGNRGLFHRVNLKVFGKFAALKPEEKVMMNQTGGPLGLETLVGLIKTMAN